MGNNRVRSGVHTCGRDGTVAATRLHRYRSEILSTDQHLRTPTPPSEPESLVRSKLDLSVTKILGGALAAMTAAALGSRLSVAGTLIGAALASIVAAVAGALYTASLERAGSRVKTIRTTKSGATVLARPEWGQPPAAPADRQARQDATSTATAVLPRTAKRRIGWKSVVVGALAIFAITAVALTSLELIAGGAIGGGPGTTIEQVRENAGPSRPTESAQPASTASPSASAEPSESAEATEEPSATQAPEPSQAPSSTATPTPSPTPTASGPATPAPSGSSTP